MPFLEKLHLMNRKDTKGNAIVCIFIHVITTSEIVQKRSLLSIVSPEFNNWIVEYFQKSAFSKAYNSQGSSGIHNVICQGRTSLYASKLVSHFLFFHMAYEIMEF